MLSFKQFLSEEPLHEGFSIFNRSDGENHHQGTTKDYEKAKKIAAESSKYGDSSFILDADGNHVGTYVDGKPKRNS